ncbi:EAL domain-containing protein [Klebsiella sp. BIGb0407]|uniref:EAL domain-containing protein n=1 Tax=Klebsiella sp. BIGb0407 TaxID=2940603 RepID=UPI0021678E5C|nr:EAL domain-containing protein [Klebsiella sp. BIGb0407]MCS3432605.1 EAL domain-containing protein (putative c-di-GMP-specific phosphodiesterase class I) [Klebsiella sp. BIGb0407]
MRVRRSLTIKQMAMVSTVAVVFIFVFIVIQLFYFVQQNRNDTVARMENMADSVRIPLAQAVLKADIPQAEEVLGTLKPAGILSRIDVVLPDQFQALGVSFAPEVKIPRLVSRLFALPVQVSKPLYALGQPGNSQPLAYLVLQADSRHLYRFILSTLSILLTTYLLLALILTVSISWFINRLVIHPIRKIAHELDNLSAQGIGSRQLQIPESHQDDEIGMLVRSYNRNQQAGGSVQANDTELPDEAAFLTLLGRYQQGALLIMTSAQQGITCQALNTTQSRLQRLIWLEKVHRLLPSSVALAQLNNDALGIFIGEVKDPWIAMKYAQQLVSRFSESSAIQPTDYRAVTSIGVAMLSPALSAKDVCHRASSAALIASYRGGDQIQFFEPLDDDSTDLLLVTKNNRLAALSDSEFAIWLQPQLNMLSGQLIGAEVLLRQQQSDEVWSLPEGLIERIEDCGLMVTVGSWVLEESCRVLSAWQKRGIMIPLSVNLSVLQLMHKDMVPALLNLLERYQVDPETLTIEITESRRIDDPQAAANILRPLHEAGVRIALDDFGMGYACLRDLHHMKSVPVDFLKIDKSFVQGLPEDGAMVEVIITMASTLDLQIVAEGVETEQQRDWLVAHGVSHAQGYLFSQAQPVAQFESRYLD